MSVTVEDVENLSAKDWINLDSDTKQDLLDMAERMLNGPFSARVSRLPTVVGDRDDALKWLTAHLWELSIGGEAQSEGQTGATVSYNTVTGEWESSLSQTRYGRTFRDVHLRDEQSIGIVMTR